MPLNSSGLVALDFFEHIDNDYGLSPDDSVVGEFESVTVPNGLFNLEPEELTELHDTVNALQESDNHGIELYLATCDFIRAH